MADVRLNFLSNWTAVQVAKVISKPSSAEVIPHNLKYPPLAMAFSGAEGSIAMSLIAVDENNVYAPPSGDGIPRTDYIVVYAIDISYDFNYKNYDSAVGEVVKDSGTCDLRKFLLHSRAVSLMLLSVATKTFTSGDMSLVYNSPLPYPTFQFGYLRGTKGTPIEGQWVPAPLASQAFPALVSDGFTSTLDNTKNPDGTLFADVGTIITLRNPAIVTSNTVDVSI